MTQWYLAPMEEVTGYLFRQILQKHFGGVDKFFTPFLSPVTGCAFKTRQGREVDPSHNAGLPVVPQVLTDDPDRGSGFLRDTEVMERFFDRMFAQDLPMPVSVKTRLGFANAEEEWPKILEVYNRYPISELIVHARVREEWYEGTPNMEAFSYAYENSKLPLCYNGDVKSADQARRLTERFPNLRAVMIGRGAVTDPGIFRELAGGVPMSAKELREFHDDLYAAFVALWGSKDTLFKMKEVWGYLGDRFPDAAKAKKRIHKCRTEAEYLAAVSELLG